MIYSLRASRVSTYLLLLNDCWITQTGSTLGFKRFRHFGIISVTYRYHTTAELYGAIYISTARRPQVQHNAHGTRIRDDASWTLNSAQTNWWMKHIFGKSTLNKTRETCRAFHSLCSFHLLTTSTCNVYSWPKPMVSSTAIVSLFCSASRFLYAGRSSRLKLLMGQSALH